MRHATDKFLNVTIKVVYNIATDDPASKTQTANPLKRNRRAQSLLLKNAGFGPPYL
jgi:hypothetical protein